ncbi:NAD-dependent epimerase/dehydratase family protein [Sphingomonas cavernae]|uniref:NAD-dependent epimerase/dehydratase family protein n=1 Tax=Sphingomonas cavernae TaxID=2320861 RepID=A0A418WQX5_9SPHN|nr:NAD-dependent epimerase/dehydratase family protein [Sphingomonas cavernae]RJF93648.1 NAD-dependent epimerase/dehydratase family protein [Sphingomonas cavernae]
MAMRTLITGAAGFIGSHLVRRLLDRGDELHLLVRPETSLSRLEEVIDRVCLHRLQLGDEAALAACLADAAPHQVYHLAAETRRTAQADFAGVELTLREDLPNLIALLAALATLRHPPVAFVRAGSIAEYGTAPVPYREDQKEDPSTPYGAGLAAGTMYLRVLEGVLPFPAITARLALVFGAGQSEAFLIPALIRACLEGRPFHVTRPSDRRDLIHVDDAVDALLLLGESQPPGCNVINIATGMAPTMREVTEQVIDITGADPALVRFGNPALDTGASVLLASPDRARSLLNWSAATTLRKGLELTVAAMLRAPALT